MIRHWPWLVIADCVNRCACGWTPVGQPHAQRPDSRTTSFQLWRHHCYIPPVALTVSFLVKIVFPFCCAVAVTSHMPAQTKAPFPSYTPSLLSAPLFSVFISCLIIDDIANMKQGYDA